VNTTLFLAAWETLAADGEVWGLVQDVSAGVLVLATTEQIAESVLAWGLGGQVIP
jgi:hypothetical protein